MALYSNSRLTGYRQCPRKFLWRYVWNVDPGVEGVEAFTGKRVHESLEELYKAVLRGSETPALSQVLDRFQELWGRFWSDSIRIVADRSPDHYRRVGGACLKRYYRRHQPFRAGTTLAVEHRFEVPLDGESSHRIRGIFDRVDIGPDGGVEVHDYKTGKRTPTLGDLGGDLQVGLYERAARHL